jgi:hypothetical protein
MPPPGCVALRFGKILIRRRSFAGAICAILYQGSNWRDNLARQYGSSRCWRVIVTVLTIQIVTQPSSANLRRKHTCSVLITEERPVRPSSVARRTAGVAPIKGPRTGVVIEIDCDIGQIRRAPVWISAHFDQLLRIEDVADVGAVPVDIPLPL